MKQPRDIEAHEAGHVAVAWRLDRPVGRVVGHSWVAALTQIGRRREPDRDEAINDLAVLAAGQLAAARWRGDPPPTFGLELALERVGSDERQMADLAIECGRRTDPWNRAAPSELI